MLFRSNAPGDVGIAEVIAIAQRLPVNELHSAEAQLLIGGGLTLLDSFGVQTAINPESSAKVKRIAQAIKDGVDRALAVTSSP